MKQWCPNPLLGTFFYTADDGTNQTCGNGSNVDVCATWTTMTFDYTKCSLEIFSSALLLIGRLSISHSCKYSENFFTDRYSIGFFLIYALIPLHNLIVFLIYFYRGRRGVLSLHNN